MTEPRYLYFCRHGQSEWNALGLLQGQVDNNLSELGKQQAKGLAQQAAKWNIQHLYHSPLARAEQTAQICARELQIIAKPLPGTQERHFGDWQGQPVSALSAYHDFRQYCYQQRNTSPNALGESTEQVQARIQSALNKIAAAMLTDPTGHALLISHGDAIDCLMTAWTEALQLNNCQAVRLVLNDHNFIWDHTFTLDAKDKI
ncbi:histidine phosphatase family protein [Paraglaciecola sp. L3A3]|uniref:histidine phosphatase family protein n=1 Tax=Paraglaciecola sp. L3A3 TaxID=2686358 RepID=UPI00131DEAC3|nr:histidine phosphatase family protein [Paraglaciecola sp. L3A3]